MLASSLDDRFIRQAPLCIYSFPFLPFFPIPLFGIAMCRQRTFPSLPCTWRFRQISWYRRLPAVLRSALLQEPPFLLASEPLPVWNRENAQSCRTEKSTGSRKNRTFLKRHTQTFAQVLCGYKVSF